MNKGENKLILDDIFPVLTSTSLGVSTFLWKEVHQFYICDRESPLVLPLYMLNFYFVEAYCSPFHAVCLLLSFYWISS